MIAGLLITISVILAALKLAGLLVTVTWFHVLLPAIIGIAIFVISLIVVLLFAAGATHAVSKGLNW